MVDYTSQHQLKFKEFGNLNQINLNPKNRWIQLAKHFPWDECISIFIRHFSEIGRKRINQRVVIGSLIIKHKLNITVEEKVMIIEENQYMQYFLMLNKFALKHLFDPSF